MRTASTGPVPAGMAVASVPWPSRHGDGADQDRGPPAVGSASTWYGAGRLGRLVEVDDQPGLAAVPLAGNATNWQIERPESALITTVRAAARRRRRLVGHRPPCGPAPAPPTVP